MGCPDRSRRGADGERHLHRPRRDGDRTHPDSRRAGAGRESGDGRCERRRDAGPEICGRERHAGPGDRDRDPPSGPPSSELERPACVGPARAALPPPGARGQPRSPALAARTSAGGRERPRPEARSARARRGAMSTLAGPPAADGEASRRGGRTAGSGAFAQASQKPDPRAADRSPGRDAPVGVDEDRDAQALGLATLTREVVGVGEHGVAVPRVCTAQPCGCAPGGHAPTVAPDGDGRIAQPGGRVRCTCHGPRHDA
jgi:hypothetical protein